MPGAASTSESGADGVDVHGTRGYGWDVENLLTILLASAGAIGAMGVIYRGAIRPTYRFVKRAGKAFEAAEKSASELTHNGGGSVKDAVHRIEDRLATFENYQHGRNHDMLGMITEVDGKLGLHIEDDHPPRS